MPEGPSAGGPRNPGQTYEDAVRNAAQDDPPWVKAIIEKDGIKPKAAHPNALFAYSGVYAHSVRLEHLSEKLRLLCEGAFDQSLAFRDSCTKLLGKERGDFPGTKELPRLPLMALAAHDQVGTLRDAEVANRLTDKNIFVHEVPGVGIFYEICPFIIDGDDQNRAEKAVNVPALRLKLPHLATEKHFLSETETRRNDDEAFQLDLRIGVLQPEEHGDARICVALGGNFALFARDPELFEFDSPYGINPADLWNEKKRQSVLLEILEGIFAPQNIDQRDVKVAPPWSGDNEQEVSTFYGITGAVFFFPHSPELEQGTD